jgi:hypothetical protein
MNVLDYFLPWKSIPAMIKDVKGTSDAKGKDRHDSVFGSIGKYGDPFGALMGKKWQNFFHGTIPREVNRALEPVGKFHRQYLDPVAMSLPKDHSLQRIPDWVQAKGGDASAIVGGLVAGGAALGAAGAGGGGGGAAGGAAGAGGGGGFGGWMEGMQGMTGFGGGMPMQPPAQRQQFIPPTSYIPSLLDFGGSPYPIRRGLLQLRSKYK